MVKDNFSSHSEEYRTFRPAYPNEVYAFLKDNLQFCKRAWDCGTGNGQVANRLAEFLEEIEATDISKNQIDNAIEQPNIKYSIQPAEKTDFERNYFDLVISGQAVHWFNFDEFYQEVRRCLKADGFIVVMGYSLFTSNPKTDRIINHFYENIIGDYWDAERVYLDEKYRNIPFPFNEIETPVFQQSYKWDIDHLLGYLRTWSAVKHYEKANAEDPVNLIEADLKKSFGQRGKVKFPILFRMGKIN